MRGKKLQVAVTLPSNSFLKTKHPGRQHFKAIKLILKRYKKLLIDNGYFMGQFILRWAAETSLRFSSA